MIQQESSLFISPLPSMLSRVFLRSCAVVPAPVAIQGGRMMSGTADRFRQKENADENKSARSHDNELVAKLRQQIADMEREKKASQPVRIVGGNCAFVFLLLCSSSLPLR